MPIFVHEDGNLPGVSEQCGGLPDHVPQAGVAHDDGHQGDGEHGEHEHLEAILAVQQGALRCQATVAEGSKVL